MRVRAVIALGIRAQNILSGAVAVVIDALGRAIAIGIEQCADM